MIQIEFRKFPSSSLNILEGDELLRDLARLVAAMPLPDRLNLAQREGQ